MSVLDVGSLCVILCCPLPPPQLGGEPDHWAVTMGCAIIVNIPSHPLPPPPTRCYDLCAVPTLSPVVLLSDFPDRCSPVCR